MGTRVCSSKGRGPVTAVRGSGPPQGGRRDVGRAGLAVSRRHGAGTGRYRQRARRRHRRRLRGRDQPRRWHARRDARPRKLEDAFLVVQDAFRSETVEYADVVLPAATWGVRRDDDQHGADRLPGSGRDGDSLRRPDGPRVDRRPRRSYRPRSVRSDTGAQAVFDEFAALTAGTPPISPGSATSASRPNARFAGRHRHRTCRRGTGITRPGMAATSRRVTSATSRQRTIPASERPTTAMRSTARPIPAAARPTNRGRSTPSPAARGSRRVRPGRFPSRPTSPIRSR